MRKLTKKIREEWNKEETIVGTFLIRWVGIAGLLSSAIGQGLEYIGAIPQEWIPDYIKTTIVFCALVGGLIGKFTNKKVEETKQRDKNES